MPRTNPRNEDPRRRKTKNDNRLVRIYNDDVHDLVKTAAAECGVNYQYAFDCFCELIADGYVVGNIFIVTLVKRIFKKSGKLLE